MIFVPPSKYFNFEKRFIGAVAAYDEESWGVCVDEMEASLQKLMIEDEKCRFVCEDKLDWSSVDANPEIDVLFTSKKLNILYLIKMHFVQTP